MINFDSIIDSASADLEAMQTQLDAESEKGKFIQDPGVYSLNVVEMLDVTKPTTPEGWAMVKLVLQDTNGRELSHWLTLPLTNNVHYPTKSGKNTLWAVKKIQDFTSALGLDFRGDKFLKNLKKYFGNGGEAIKGQIGQFEIGYETGNYAQYVGKDQYQVVVGNKPFLDENGTPVVLTDHTAVEGYITTTLNKQYSAFMSIIGYIKRDVQQTTTNNEMFAG